MASRTPSSGPVPLAAPVVPAVAAFATGWLAAVLTVREYPSEVGARRAMDVERAVPSRP